jgi:hypothetical protein
MNVYIKTNDSTRFAAIRATRAQVAKILPNPEFVKSTRELLRMARARSIPTLIIRPNGALGYL